ncbi:MAG: caspase family protein [Myxococcales bacterium]
MSLSLLLPLLALAVPPSVTAQAPAPEETTLALIVASNRSAARGRPPLQYADDDGAKYYEVFAALAGEEQAMLLTDLDRDTTGLFPGLVDKVRAPTLANLSAAVDRLAERSAAARRAGARVRFYFVFAGHGDVDEGRGFLELADGPFRSGDLDQLLARVAATEAHVILDSCNSFFVVNPRRPGGRRLATPRDAAESLSRRLPNVGVFLSTSAEAEVFEWSELQSGVFSHAVRSGLLGAADANGDGKVSYQELAAFVETAAARLKNPAYRPKIFARGPGGDDARTLFALPADRAVVLRVGDGAGLRLTVRGPAGLRWLDANVEAGATLELRLPRSLAASLEVERLRPDGSRSVEERLSLPREWSPAPLTLASLPRAEQELERRGASDFFGELFAQPFGPRALESYLVRKASEPEPVFGLSAEDGERMSLILGQLADSDRTGRTLSGTLLLGTGGIFLVSNALALQAHLDKGSVGDRSFQLALDTGLLVLDVGLLLWGASQFWRQTEAEELRSGFDEALRDAEADPVQVIAAADRRLRAIQRSRQSKRIKLAVAGGVIATFGLTVFLLDHLGPSSWTRAGGGLDFMGAGGSMMALAFYSQDSGDTAIQTWERDPAMRKLPRLGLAPLRSGAAVVATGRW